jgi:hypothetical protein
MAKVHAAPTGACTLNVDGTGARKWYDGNLVQLGSGSLTLGEMAGSVFDNTLDSGVGGWIRVTNPGAISTITAGMIPAGLITSTMIADGTIATADLASNAVTTANITDANVTAAKLASNSVTTAKIADANVTLAKLAADAYQTGSWTPAMTFGGSATGITYSTQTGIYTKIGNVVHITGHITLTNNGTGSGGAAIGGLPFAPNSTHFPAVSFSFYNNFSGIAGMVFGDVNGTSSTILLFAGGSVGFAQLTDANITNTADFGFSATYFV